MRKFKKAVSIVLVNAGILAVLLLLIEIVLRSAGIPYKENFTPSENAIARFDSERGWSYIPNLSRTIRYGSQVRTVHFDESGIRVPAPGTRLSAEKPSVLFIGCSFTMGHGLSYEESFPGQFATMTGNRYQAVNLGVQAYGTDQALLALKKFAPRFNAKVVVYTFIEEHIYRNGNYDRRYLYPDAKVLGTKPLFALDKEARPYLSRKPLRIRDYRNSYLFDLLMMKLETAFNRRPPYPEDLTKALIREMDAYCRMRNIHFIMVNWRWRESDYDNFNDLQIDRIDTLKDAPAGWDHMIIPGEDHPSARACRHVAHQVRVRLSELGLL